MTPEQDADFLRLFHRLCESPPPYGWKRVKLDDQQRDYVIGMESVFRASRDIQRIGWQQIQITNKELAMKIRENALHSLATLAQAMRLNEEEMLG